MPQVGGTLPVVASPGSVRAPVSVGHYGVPLPRVEVGRFNQDRFHRESVAGFHPQPLYRPPAIFIQNLDPVFLDGAHQTSIRPLQAHLRRGLQVAPGVQKTAEIRREAGTMRAWTLRQPLQLRAVQTHPIDPFVDGPVQRSRQIRPLLRGINPMKRTHVPLAVRDLTNHLSGRIEMVQVLPAAALAQQQKAFVLQPDRVVPPFHPRRRGLPEQLPRRVCPAVADQKVQPGLLPVLDLKIEPALRTPSHPYDQDRLGPIRG